MLEVEGVEALVLNPGPTLLYLTGLDFHLMERPVIGIFPREGVPRLILPQLEVEKAQASELSFELFPYQEDPASRGRAIQAAASPVARARAGIEPLRMRIFELDLLREAVPDLESFDASALIETLRGIKGPEEVRWIKRAAEIAERALRATIPLVRIGMSERDLEAELNMQLLKAGSEVEFPFRPIVASGPNSALPHATPGSRTLAAGDLLILDWGARVKGYISDISRTFGIGEVDPDLAGIHRLVREANQAGHEAVRPGVTCQEIDRAARQVIEGGGYGDFFLHRTGHGIGLESHEAPYIVEGNHTHLEPGMTFTIEPGIYLPERAGVRIEDNLVVTSVGADLLTSYPRELEMIG